MIQKGWRPGLVGEIVRAHAIYYARDWNFPRYFEAKVAREMGEFLARTSDIRISETHHGPPGARRFSHEPTYLLHGLTELHIEFERVG